MRVTIIADDSAVYVDGLALNVDISSLDPTIHAVQWYDTHGEIEYKSDADGNRKPNEKITDLSPFQHHVVDWHAAKTAYDAAVAAMIAARPVYSAPAAGAPVNVIAD